MATNPLVYLVGAGPGHSGLLTLRAAECLGRADLIIYDSLVSPQLLNHAPPHAERLCITAFGPRHCERIGLVIEKLIEAARQGKCVVRLKGGDAFLFGRGGEEAEALARAGIPFEVVPGVTAALGAAAFAGIPLTHRGLASAVAFVTGHEDPLAGDAELDWAALARFPGTLVVYMGLSRISAICHALMANGKPVDTPSAVIHWATTGRQRTITAPLNGIAAAAQAAELTSPSLVLIGPVVSLRSDLNWFERRPLFGRRILMCRPQAQAGDLAERLEELGAVPLVLPVVEIHPPADWSAVDAAIDELATFHWLVFTSVNGVHSFLGRLEDKGRDLRALGHLKLAAIGPATAAALREYHLNPDLVPSQYRSESLAEELKPEVAGKRVLLARADRGREVLLEKLQAIAQVRQIAVYSQMDAASLAVEIVGSLERGEIDAVLLTSSNIARALARLLNDPCNVRMRSGQVKIVCISPVTSATVRELGWPVAGEAEAYTINGTVDALVEVFGKKREMAS